VRSTFAASRRRRVGSGMGSWYVTDCLLSLIEGRIAAGGSIADGAMVKTVYYSQEVTLLYWLVSSYSGKP